ncbi:hypothetical protein Trydic_g18311 [Trypoxylus dichotomus]
MDKPRSGQSRTSKTAENVESAHQSVRGCRCLPVRKRANASNVPESSINRILRKKLGLRHCKLSLAQELKPTDPGVSTSIIK